MATVSFWVFDGKLASMNGESLSSPQQFRQLRDAFFQLHKTLVESERVEYERVMGTIDSPAEFVRLLMTDSWFSWLRPYSQWIVSMDEAFGKNGSPTIAQLGDLSNRCRELLTVTSGDKGAAGHYFNALQRDPDVILAHAAVMRQLGARLEKEE